MTDAPSLRSAALAGLTRSPGMPPIRCLFQPIVDLNTGDVVGFEALARGIDDNSEAGNSDALFEWARRTGRLAELDWACRIAAMQTALRLGLPAGTGLFINVEPAALGGPPPDGFAELVDDVREAGLSVVIEFTERALADNTAGLLRLGDWIREQGWSVAIDDIGADPGSLALVPLLRPEFIKLDLRLIQARTTVDVAQIVNAVNAEAGRTGAMVLAEGIETDRHAALAVSMGAHLGQGWFYGRPTLTPPTRTRQLPVPRSQPTGPSRLPDVPWDLVADSQQVRRAEKVLIEAMSRHLERQAMASTDPVVVVGAFQNVEQYNASTARRFAALAASGAVTAVLGHGVPDEPSVGVQGQSLSAHDPIGREWSIAVVSAHFAGALIAADRGSDEAARSFDYVVTYDRATVLAAAEIMLRRLEPRRSELPAPVGDTDALPEQADPAASAREDRRLLVLAKAIAASANGITVVDATAPDLPLVYVNEGFERLTGYRSGEMLGRNCRFLQGPQTSTDSIDELRALVQAAESGRVTLLNYRRDGTPWWNEIQLSPVRSPTGELTHFMGVHTDVTERVSGAALPVGSASSAPPVGFRSSAGSAAPAEGPAVRAEPAFRSSGALTTQYSVPVLHRRDPATPGQLATLADAAAARTHLERLLHSSQAASSTTALLLCSIDRIPTAPSVWGDPDDGVLVEVAAALDAVVGVDLLFHDGAGEFGVVCRLDQVHDVVAAYALAGRMHQAVIERVAGDGATMSIGIALSPADGTTVEMLWRSAEAALVLAEDTGPSGTRYASDVAIAGLHPAHAVSLGTGASWPSW